MDAISQYILANSIVVFRFVLGAIGALTYFAVVKSGFVKIEETSENIENPYLEKIHYVLFFCFIGGLLSILFETNFIGAFVQGLLLRPTLKGLIERGTTKE
jgi:hypothetical protein